MRVTSKPEVERHELASRREQHLGSLVHERPVEHDGAAKAGGLRALAVVRRLQVVEQRQGQGVRARGDLGACCRDRAVGTVARLRAELSRPEEKGADRRVAPVEKGRFRRGFELGGHVFVGADRSTRAMPGPSVAIRREVGDRGECSVHTPAIDG